MAHSVATNTYLVLLGLGCNTAATDRLHRLEGMYKKCSVENYELIWWMNLDMNEECFEFT